MLRPALSIKAVRASSLDLPDPLSDIVEQPDKAHIAASNSKLKLVFIEDLRNQTVV